MVLGIAVHTGWAACVVAGGTIARPVIAAREEIELLADPERFVFHRAAEMRPAAAARWIARMRAKAIAKAKAALAPFDVRACAIVAKPGEAGELAEILASHPRIHTAEGVFYRDVLCDAIDVPVTIIAPSELDTKSMRIATIGKLVGRPWANDQKLAALAAWRL